MSITFVGEAHYPPTLNANTTSQTAEITPPGGMQANDYVLMFASDDQASSDFTLLQNGGQTWVSTSNWATNSTVGRFFHCRYNGTWSNNPIVSHSVAQAYVIWFAAFRGVDTTTAIDAGPVSGGFAAPASPFTVAISASALTTVTNNACVVAYFMTQDNNTWASQSAGWSAATTGTTEYWQTAGGTDASNVLLYQIQGTAGGNAVVSESQATLGGDPGHTFMVALRPAVTAGGPTIKVWDSVGQTWRTSTAISVYDAAAGTWRTATAVSIYDAAAGVWRTSV